MNLCKENINYFISYTVYYGSCAQLCADHRDLPLLQHHLHHCQQADRLQLRGHALPHWYTIVKRTNPPNFTEFFISLDMILGYLKNSYVL